MYSCARVCAPPRRSCTHTQRSNEVGGAPPCSLPPKPTDRQQTGNRCAGVATPPAGPPHDERRSIDIIKAPRDLRIYIYIYPRNFTLSLTRSLSLSLAPGTFINVFLPSFRIVSTTSNRPSLRTGAHPVTVGRRLSTESRSPSPRTLAVFCDYPAQCTVTYARLLPSPTASRDRKGQDLTCHGVQWQEYTHAIRAWSVRDGNTVSLVSLMFGQGKRGKRREPA